MPITWNNSLQPRVQPPKPFDERYPKVYKHPKLGEFRRLDDSDNDVEVMYTNGKQFYSVNNEEWDQFGEAEQANPSVPFESEEDLMKYYNALRQKTPMKPQDYQYLGKKYGGNLAQFNSDFARNFVEE